MNKKNLILILFFTIFIVVARLIPHLPNFVPITTVALFLGAYFNKKLAIILPLLGLLISDAVIGFYDWQLMLAVYCSFAIIGVFSWWLKKNKGIFNVLSIVLLSSVFFFIITNFAVWIFSSWYTKNLTGLLYCFQLAIPFFRYTLAGNLFYSTVLFGSFELVKMFAKLKLQKNKISIS